MRVTEKLLLFGGAINLAGQVKAKGERRNTRSDWMKIERERWHLGSDLGDDLRIRRPGFQPFGHAGHEDFSEDTYRTLTGGRAPRHGDRRRQRHRGAGREKTVRGGCRLRDIPIITFINKMDRDSRDTFDLLDEIEKTLALDTTPMTWPVGRGRDFLGTYDVANGACGCSRRPAPRPRAAQQIDIAELAGRNPNLDVAAIKDELALVSEPANRSKLEAFREGHLTPVYFGSALRNFGGGDLLDGLGRFRAAAACRRSPICARSKPPEPRMSAFGLQDPGQYGPEPPRPAIGVCAFVAPGKT